MHEDNKDCDLTIKGCSRPGSVGVLWNRRDRGQASFYDEMTAIGEVECKHYVLEWIQAIKAMEQCSCGRHDSHSLLRPRPLVTKPSRLKAVNSKDRPKEALNEAMHNLQRIIDQMVFLSEEASGDSSHQLPLLNTTALIPLLEVLAVYRHIKLESWQTALKLTFFLNIFISRSFN